MIGRPSECLFWSYTEVNKKQVRDQEWVHWVLLPLEHMGLNYLCASASCQIPPQTSVSQLLVVFSPWLWTLVYLNLWPQKLVDHSPQPWTLKFQCQTPWYLLWWWPSWALFHWWLRQALLFVSCSVWVLPSCPLMNSCHAFKAPVLAFFSEPAAMMTFASSVVYYPCEWTCFGWKAYSGDPNTCHNVCKPTWQASRAGKPEEVQQCLIKLRVSCSGRFPPEQVSVLF